MTTLDVLKGIQRIMIEKLIAKSDIIISVSSRPERSELSIYVQNTDFTVYDTRTNKIIFQQENCGLAEKEKPIRYNLKFSGVYKPLFLWHYHHSGKSYTCEYRM